METENTGNRKHWQGVKGKKNSATNTESWKAFKHENANIQNLGNLYVQVISWNVQHPLFFERFVACIFFMVHPNKHSKISIKLHKITVRHVNWTHRTKIETVQVHIFVGSGWVLSHRRVLHVKPSCIWFFFSFLSVVCSKTFSIAENSYWKHICICLSIKKK